MSDDVSKLLAQLAEHRSRDSRLTSLHTWFTVSVGTVGIAVAGWGVKSINELNQSVATMNTRYEYETKRTDRVEKHLEVIDGRVVILERNSGRR